MGQQILAKWTNNGQQILRQWIKNGRKVDKMDVKVVKIETKNPKWTHFDVFFVFQSCDNFMFFRPTLQYWHTKAKKANSSLLCPLGSRQDMRPCTTSPPQRDFLYSFVACSPQKIISSSRDLVCSTLQILDILVLGAKMRYFCGLFPPLHCVIGK